MAPPKNFNPALIVVDLQEDFCPPDGALPVPEGREVIQPINQLLSLPFTIKIATKDWHPPDHVSFASNHPAARPFLSTTTVTHPNAPGRSYDTLLWPAHCIQNSPGAALVSELDFSKLDGLIEKGTDPRIEMYSAFTDPFHTGNLPWPADSTSVCTSVLPKVLTEKGITDVFVVGLAMDFCVKCTAEDAVKFGYRTYIVTEATRAVVGGDGWKLAEEEMVRNGVEMVSIDGDEVGWVRALIKSG